MTLLLAIVHICTWILYFNEMAETWQNWIAIGCTKNQNKRRKENIVNPRIVFRKDGAISDGLNI